MFVGVLAQAASGRDVRAFEREILDELADDLDLDLLLLARFVAFSAFRSGFRLVCHWLVAFVARCGPLAITPSLSLQLAIVLA